MAQILEFLSPVWEIQMESLAPVFSLAQAWLLCGHLESKATDGRSLCVSSSAQGPGRG